MTANPAMGFQSRGIVYYQRALKRRYKVRLAALRRRLKRAESIPQQENIKARIDLLTMEYEQELTNSNYSLY